MSAAAAELAELRERVDDLAERLAAYDKAWSVYREATERIAAERAEAMSADVSAAAPRRLRVVRDGENL